MLVYNHLVDVTYYDEDNTMNCHEPNLDLLDEAWPGARHVVLRLFLHLRQLLVVIFLTETLAEMESINSKNRGRRITLRLTHPRARSNLIITKGLIFEQ